MAGGCWGGLISRAPTWLRLVEFVVCKKEAYWEGYCFLPLFLDWFNGISSGRVVFLRLGASEEEDEGGLRTGGIGDLCGA